MIFIEYLLLLLTLFSSTFVGLLLAYIAPEELRSGKKYIFYFQTVIIILIPSLIFYFIGVDVYTISLFLLLLGLLYFKKEDQTVSFYLMGLVAFASLSNNVLINIESTLVFILGMLVSLLYTGQYEENEKMIKPFFHLFGEILLKYSLFVVLGLLPYWIL